MSVGQPMKQTYVCFLSPGSLRVVEDIRLVANRTTCALVIPPSTFGFYFFDQYTLVHYEAEEPIELTSERKHESGTFFIAREKPLFIEAALVRYVGEQRRLNRLKEDGYHQVIRCVTGGWQGFEPGDCAFLPEAIPVK